MAGLRRVRVESIGWGRWELNSKLCCYATAMMAVTYLQELLAGSRRHNTVSINGVEPS